MAFYDLKTYRPSPGSRGRMVDAEMIEAADDAAAFEEARRRTRGLPADHFAILFDEQERQLAVFEAKA